MGNFADDGVTPKSAMRYWKARLSENLQREVTALRAAGNTSDIAESRYAKLIEESASGEAMQ